MGRKTPGDPTGLASKRRQGERLINSRLREAKRQIKQLVREIPATRRVKKNIATNQDETVFYDYQYSPENQQDTETTIAAIIAIQLLGSAGGQNPPADWYWSEYIEQPYRQGVTEEIRNGNRSVQLANRLGMTVNGVPPAEIEDFRILYSSTYSDELRRVVRDGFTNISGLSATTQAQVTRVINQGIASRISPAEIVNQITARFDVAESSAKRTVQTSVNTVYTNAKMQTAQQVEDITGLRTGVVHISALLPTTRTWHASRHAKAYTREEQEAWWNEGSNRINCYCSVRSILLNEDGTVADTDLLRNIALETLRLY